MNLIFFYLFFFLGEVAVSMSLNEQVLDAFGMGWIMEFLPPGSYSFTYATGPMTESAIDPIRYILIDIDPGFSFLTRMDFAGAPPDSMYYGVSFIIASF